MLEPELYRGDAEPCVEARDGLPAATPVTSLDWVVPLHCAALLLAAFLLFAIEPMVTKMILPLLGGTPAVWNTALMFFQAMLLAGYLYAHLLSRLSRMRRQVLVHVSLLAAGLLFLPVHLAWRGVSPGGTHPVAWLVALLTLSIGLPFFAVSATAPLLQRWFSRSSHARASDPYFLYVASNVGGLAALLAYPVVIEPLLGLAVQGRVWAAGYALLTLIIVLCAIRLWLAQRRHRSGGSIPAVADPQDLTPGGPLARTIGWDVRARWLALSFVPSALLLAVTSHISTDVASVPFLWVAPLSLYMLSFIIVFARRPILKHKWMLAIQIPVYALLALYFTEQEFLLVLALHLAALFVTALVCHGELVRRRPAAEHLTEFYLWMSVGGLLGGVFCVLVAPLVFPSVLEYPVLLILACLLRPVSGPSRLNLSIDRGWRRPLFDVLVPALFALSCYLVYGSEDSRVLTALGVATPVLIYLAVAAVFYSFHRRPVRLALGFAPLVFGTIFVNDIDHCLYRQRSFFGVYTVSTNEQRDVHYLYHGNIVHGDQCMDEASVRTPTSYYHGEGPLGQVFDALRAVRPLKNVGCVGLGTGTTVCYQEPGQTMTFFEVDPVMERIARNPRLFRYLELAGPDVTVVLGDGRQSLATMADGTFDLLVLDAFSSDAIPVHLLTREALALYLRKLAPSGLVLFHISNRYVDLEPVLANLAVDAGIDALVEEYEPTDDTAPPEASSGVWVALAGRTQDLAPLQGQDDGWRPLQARSAVGVWTDDYSNLFRTLIWDTLF